MYTFCLKVMTSLSNPTVREKNEQWNMIFFNPLHINSGIILLKLKTKKYGLGLIVRDFKQVVKRVKF